MNFSYSEAQLMVAQAAKEFVKKCVRPYAMERDEGQEFPIEVFRRTGDLGFMGILVPEIYGGSGLDYHGYIAIVEGISEVDPSAGLSIAAHNSLCTNRVLSFGSEEQRQRWLPELASGEWIGVWDITEHNTGSDSGGMATTAVKNGGSWVLNRAENFITHGKSRQIAVVITHTDEKGDKYTITTLAVERRTPGFSNGRKGNELGIHASETTELVFQDCRIPDTNRLDEVGEGFIRAMKMLDGGRVSIGALLLSIAKRAYGAALKYAKERVQFGKHLVELQRVSFKLADMATEIEASELLLHKAAYQENNHQRVTLSGAVARMYSSEMCTCVTTKAIQIHGDYGYAEDFPVERFSRDSKLCTIGKGTTEIQKLVVSRQIDKL